MLGLRLALTAPGAAGLLDQRAGHPADPAWLERAWQGHQGTLSLIRGR
jgi:hypothetical protein